MMRPSSMWMIFLSGALIVGAFFFVSEPPPTSFPTFPISDEDPVAAVAEKFTIVKKGAMEDLAVAPLIPSLFTGGTVHRENDPIGSKSRQDIFLVTRVIDGDTVELEGGERVRYIGVNTPESVDPRRAVQCFGKEASAYNKKLVAGKRVRLESDVEDRDKYGRLLRYVWIDDTMINEQLVTDGYAQLMTISPNVKYADRFRIAQTQAREAKRGLWSKCKNK